MQQFGRGRRTFASWNRGIRRHKLRLGLAAAAIIAVVAAVWLDADWFRPQPIDTPQQTESSRPKADPNTIVEAERGYDDELEAARKEMHRASGGSVFLHGEDSWRRQMESLKRDFARIESRENSQ